MLCIEDYPLSLLTPTISSEGTCENAFRSLAKHKPGTVRVWMVEFQHPGIFPDIIQFISIEKAIGTIEWQALLSYV